MKKMIVLILMLAAFASSEKPSSKKKYPNFPKNAEIIETKTSVFIKIRKDGNEDGFTLMNSGADSLYVYNSVENGLKAIEFMPNGLCNIYIQKPDVVHYDLSHYDEVYRSLKTTKDGRCLIPFDSMF